MIHLKNKKPGFTLIEVLLATAIVGIVLIPIFALQGRMMERIIKSAGEVHRMFVAYNFFVITQRNSTEPKKKMDKKSDDPVMQMNFERSELSSKSALQKQFNNIYLEQLSWQWTVDGKKRKDALVAFTFEPPEPEPEKEEKEGGDKKDAKPEKASEQAGSQKAPQAGGKK